MTHSHIQTYFFLIVLSAILVLTFFIFLPYLNALIMAGILAVIFRPLCRILQRKGHLTGGLAAIITILVVFIAIFTPLVFLGKQVFHEARQVYLSVVSDGGSAFWSHIERLLSALPGDDTWFNASIASFRADTQNYLGQFLSWVLGHFDTVFASVTKTAINLFVGLIALYYFLKDGSALKQKMIDLSPLSTAYDRQIFDRLQTAVNSVIRGQLVIAVIQGVLTGLGLSIFGVPNAALWGLLAMFAALIPGIGTSLVLIPAIVYLFATGTAGPGIGLLIWSILAVGLIDNFLGPRMISKKIRVHSLLILLSILGGVGVFGPIGFFAGPLVISLLFALLDIYKSLILHEGQLTE